MPIGKNDYHARADLGGVVFDAIPKSIFATLAFRLAGRLAGGSTDRAIVFPVMADELEALAAAGIVPINQVKRALKPLLAAH